MEITAAPMGDNGKVRRLRVHTKSVRFNAGRQLNGHRLWLARAKMLLRVAVMLLATTAMASVAQGQTVHTPALEIAAGYQSLQRDGTPEFSGWFVSAARPLGARFSIVGEFADVSYRDVDPVYVDSGRYYTYLAGIQYAFPVSRMRPFVQVLAGAATAEVQQDLMLSGVPASSFTLTRHSGALQFGAGTDIRITRRVAARVMANAFTDYYDGGSLTRFRFTTGAVFGIGSR